MRKPDGSRPTYVSLFLFDFWLVTFSKVVSTPLKHTPSPRGGFKHFFFIPPTWEACAVPYPGDPLLHRRGSDTNEFGRVGCPTKSMPLNAMNVVCVFFERKKNTHHILSTCLNFLMYVLYILRLHFPNIWRTFVFLIFHFLGSEVCPDSWLCVSFPQSGLHLGGALNPWVCPKRCGLLPGLPTDCLDWDPGSWRV